MGAGVAYARQPDGTTKYGGKLLLYSQPNGGTFTLTVAMPTGITCVLFIGEGWSTIKTKPGRDS